MSMITKAVSDSTTFLAVLKLLLTIVLTAAVVTLILSLEKKAAKRLIKKRSSINIRFVESVFRFIIIFLAVQWVMMSSSLTQSFGRVLFQGTAVIGAIVGFAAQPVLSDLICGLMISAAKPFDIGDRIELEDGTAGIVKDITLRHVTLQDIDTSVCVIPNSRLNSMKIRNMSFHTKIRSVHFRFAVGYDTDIEKAMQVIGDAVKESGYSIPGRKGTDGNEYSPVYFIEYSDSSLVMATTVYYEPVVPAEVVKSDINTRVKHALDKNGIEIPYKYVNVVTKGQDKAS